MAINKSMRRVLKALSFDGIEVEASRHLANLKAIDPMKIFHKTIDYKIYNGNHQIPVRIFLPGEKMEDDLPVFLFFHGWRRSIHFPLVFTIVIWRQRLCTRTSLS